jgi:N-acetylmuramoyl-L-alanine amidase
VPLAPHEASLYISIHVNASLDKRASGFEVWYLNPGYRRTVLEKSSAGDSGVSTDLFSILNSMAEEEYTTESILIAKFVLEGLQAQVGKLSTPRGIKAEEWFVVRNANMPSVLVELGFVTNEKEAELLNSADYLNKTAEGIYNGLSAFVRHFEQSRGFTGTR